MDTTRVLSAALAVNRIAFGASYLARPEHARSNWIGRAARKPGAQVMIRSQGARDVALGLGALAALARGRDTEARTWFAAHALADAADTVTTFASRDRLPKRRARMVVGIGGLSTAIAALGATRLGRAGDE